MKHAGVGSSARVRLDYSSGGVDIEVIDDGNGRSPALVDTQAGAETGRYGLVGLAERAAALDGTLWAGPVYGGGWRVGAHLRFDHEPVP
jgi:signal transduction histidine kinase